MTKQDILNAFREKVNMYDVSKDAIDDDNYMLHELIKDCKELLSQLEKEKHPSK